MNDDCFVPHFQRSISPTCKGSLLSGGDESLRSGEDRANKIYGTEVCGCLVDNGECVEYRFPTASHVGAVHLVFDSDLNRETLPGDWCEQGHVTRANVLLDSPQMHIPTTLCKSFCLSAITDAGEVELLCVKNKIKRSYHVPVNARMIGLRLRMTDNWGDLPKTNLVSFDFN